MTNPSKQLRDLGFVTIGFGFCTLEFEITPSGTDIKKRDCKQSLF